MTTPKECWRLWQQRQQLSGSDIDLERARLAVETHLERIEHHRPLEQIQAARQRTEAKQTRIWYRTEFLCA